MSAAAETSNPAGRRAAVSAVAYLAAAAALVVGAGGLALDLRSRAGDVAAASERLARLEAHARPPATVAGDAEVAGSPFLEGATQTIAGAALLSRVGAAVVKAGGVMTSSQIELDGPRAKDDFVDLIATIEIGQIAMQTLLYDLEAGMPYLTIDKLTIQSPEAFGEPESGRMRLTMTVSGRWRGPP